jgi:hypothetical protein
MSNSGSGGAAASPSPSLDNPIKASGAESKNCRIRVPRREPGVLGMRPKPHGTGDATPLTRDQICTQTELIRTKGPFIKCHINDPTLEKRSREIRR